MPHLILKGGTLPKLPAEVEGVKFLFKAGPMIGVEVEGERFLLKLLPREGGEAILKYEKRTRPLLKLLKRSYLAFLELTGAQVVRENVFGIKEKPLSPYLMKITDNFSDVKIVEIGFGSGRNLLQLARENPDKIVLGVEIYNPAIEQVLRRVKVEGVENVRVINYDARLLLSRIPSNQLEQIHLHFPVPWEEKPHRRVVNREFLEEVFRSLEVGGIFYLRTDSPVYRDYTIGELLQFPAVQFNLRKNFRYRITSKYEARWQRLGRDIYDIIVQNWESSPPVRGEYQFQFEGPLCNWRFEPILFDRYLIHIERVYPIEGGGELVQGSIGPFNRVERVFILNRPFNREEASYFRPPAPVEENYLAHQQLKRLFKCR
jgi:tRNA (guanine-N7-)-methyltransferase